MAEQTAAVIEKPAAAGLGLPAGLLRTARPRQWVKNGLVLAAPFAAARLLTGAQVVRLGVVFLLFTACAAAVYLINDARDAEADRAHPVKCSRPVAAGHVPVPVAYGVGAALAVLAPAVAAMACNPHTGALLAGYVGIQLAYCVWLKHILVVDLVIVTTGFLMRAMAGGIALGIELSRWFLVTSGFGALFMVAAKRYSELVLMSHRPAVRPGPAGERQHPAAVTADGPDAPDMPAIPDAVGAAATVKAPGAGPEPPAGPLGASRPLLGSYTPGYLRFVWQLAAGVAVLAYCLWAMETGGRPHGWLPWRQLSMVPFILSVLRYAVFADSGAAGAPEDLVLRDGALVVIALAWGALYVLAVINT